MKRKIVSKPNSKKQFYQVARIGLGLGTLGLFLTLMLVGFAPSLHLPHTLVIDLLSSVAIIEVLLVILTISAYFTRETVPAYPVAHMDVGQKKIATAIKHRLNEKIIIDVLKLSSETRYGYEMPAVTVYIDPTKNAGFIAIENQGRADKLDHNLLAESISGVLNTKKLRRFTVVSSELTKDNVFYIFYIEDTKTSQRLMVRNNDITPFISDNAHEIKLAKDLTWKVDGATPFLSIIGRTRSGKSFFVANYLLPLMEAQGWIIQFNSIKDDIYVHRYQGYSDPGEIVAQMEYWVAIMKTRNRKITKAGKEKYSQMSSMPDVAVVIDEIGSLNAALKTDKNLYKRWVSAITSLSSTGASTGIHLIALAQYANVDGFLPGAARTNLADSVIFLGMAADSASDRQFLVPGSDIPSRRYDVGQGLARIVTAGRKWEQLHFYETPYFEEYKK